MNTDKVKLDWDKLAQSLRDEIQEYGGLLNLLKEQQEGILKRDHSCLSAMNATITANVISIGTGTWVPLNVLSTVANTLNPTTAVALPGQGNYGFVWEVSNSIYCPTKRDTVYIQTFANPSIANAGADYVSSCFMSGLNGNTPTIGNGNWTIISGSGTFDNISNPSAQFISDRDGITQLGWVISNGNCPVSIDTIEVQIDPLLIPQIITPNADGNNDAFEIKSFGCLTNVKINIFNRWGNLVYNSSDYKNDFVGVNNSGNPLADDTYYYVIEIGNKTYKGYFVIKTN